MKDSPYLEPCRLGDVIAAIQVLAYYKFYRLDVASWAERITGDRANAASLEAVFRDHPEFFQVTKSGGDKDSGDDGEDDDDDDDGVGADDDGAGAAANGGDAPAAGKPVEITKAALVARRSFTRSYDVDDGEDISRDEAMARRKDKKAWARLSRRPLTPEETAVLIRTAVDLHSRAVEQRKAGFWWVSLAGAGIGFIGAIAAVWVGGKMG